MTICVEVYTIQAKEVEFILCIIKKTKNIATKGTSDMIDMDLFMDFS